MARVAQWQSGGTSDPRRRGFDSLRALQEFVVAAWSILTDREDPEYRDAFIGHLIILAASAALVSTAVAITVLLL